MKQIPECFETTPIVYAVGDQYQIMVPVLAETLMWAEVNGKCYYDDVNGIMRSNCTTHRMTVPMDELNSAGGYTVCYRIVQERKPYFSLVEDVCRYEVSFRPVKEGNLRFYHISDTHNAIEKPVASAKVFGDIDFLVLNGDLPNHSGDIANFATIHKIAAEITGGEIPVVFSRGNHDMRGIYAEKIAEHTPTDGGNAYFTFRLGDFWGIVLDCGEDKLDDHPEYAYTVCCADFRRRQTAFIEDVIRRASEEYAAEGVTKRVVISHVPFTQHFHAPFNIEEDTYEKWTKLICENIQPQTMMFGHIHTMYVTRPGDARDAYGQNCPVVVGSSPKAFIEPALENPVAEDVFVGVGFDWNEDGCAVSFCGSNGQVLRTEKLF